MTQIHSTKNGTAYWTYNDPKLPVIIMIHGFRGTHHGLDLIVGQLPAYHHIVPDVPGFGDSKPLASHYIEDYVTWLHVFMNELDLKTPPILLGHSFGSIVSSAYAATYPQTITKLILVNPIGAPALEGPKAILTQLALFYYWLGQKLPKKLAHAWLSAQSVVMIMSITMAKTRDKTLRRYIHRQHLLYFSRFYDPTTLSQSFTTSVTHTVREYAPNVSTKTLLIAADKDDITPIERQRELVAMFPNAQLIEIKNVGHLTHYETPDQVAAAIADFI